MRKFLLYFILILSLLGAIDASYLVIQSVGGSAVICPNVPISRFNLNQCNTVLNTPYAKIFSLPTALYGLVAYLLFTILVLCEMTGKWIGANKFASYFSGIGFSVSLYFVYLQFFVIEAICFYCIVSALIITLIFIGTVVYNFKYSMCEGV